MATIKSLEKKFCKQFYVQSLYKLHKYHWDYISKYQKLNEQFIEKYKDYINWNYISEYQNLSEDFIQKHKDLVNWNYISKFQKLSEVFIQKHKDLVNWDFISKYQNLSEVFIEKHKDLVNWNYISKFQKLSEVFIQKHKDLVNWDYISKYQKLSNDFINKFKLKIDEDNWLYKPIEFKKQQVVNSGLYEYYEDYFIAYKGIRNDNYSYYNFQYKYEIGGIYKSHADFTNNEISFGLSTWTLEKAKKYYNEKIVKVKIYYSDIARLLYNGSKIRCTKLEVMEEILS